MRSLAHARRVFASGGITARTLGRTVGNGRAAGRDSCRRTGAGTGDASGNFIGTASGSGTFRRFLARDNARFRDAALAGSAFVAKRHGSFRARGAFAFRVLKACAAVFRRAQASDKRGSAFSFRAGLERGFGTSENDIRVHWALRARRRRRNLNGVASAGACCATSNVTARADLGGGEFAADARAIEVGVAGALLRGARGDAAVRCAACGADGADAHARGAVYAEVFRAADRRGAENGNGFRTDDAMFLKTRTGAFCAGIETYETFRATGKLRAVLTFIHDGKTARKAQSRKKHPRPAADGLAVKTGADHEVPADLGIEWP